MTITYPNQKLIHINKKKCQEGYLSIDYDDWTRASNDLTYNAFKLYLYLANNANDFTLALSKVALKNDINMSDNTYHKVVTELINKDYLVKKEGVRYDFYTVPKRNIIYSNDILHSESTVYHTTVGDNIQLECDSISHPNSREISNIPKNNYLSKAANAQKKKEEKKESFNSKRKIIDLTDEEKGEIIKHYTNRAMEYPEMYKHYNLEFGCLTKEVINGFEQELRNKENVIKNAEVLTNRQKGLQSLGLTSEEGDLLTTLLFGWKWSETQDTTNIVTDLVEEYITSSNMTAHELLEFFKNNDWATAECYGRYSQFGGTDSRLIIDNEHRWDSYSDYFVSCIINTDEVKNLMLEKRRSDMLWNGVVS